MYDFRVSNDGADSDILVRWLARGLDRKKGKTQTGLANKLGVGQARISEMLKKTRRIHTNEIPKIAEYLEQPPPKEWLRFDLSADLAGSSDPRKNKRELRIGLHEDPNLVWVFLVRDDKIIDQFEANIDDLDTYKRQLIRAIQSLPKPK